MPKSLPALSGDELIELLKLDGWQVHNKSTHGMTLKKFVNDKFIVTTVPIKKKSPLANGTLQAILSSKQTGIGSKGLKELIRKHKAA